MFQCEPSQYTLIPALCLTALLGSAASAAPECNFHLGLSDEADLIDPITANVIRDEIIALNDEYDIRLFFCLSPREPDYSFDHQVEEAFHRLVVDHVPSDSLLLVYLNTYVRQMTSEVSGSKLGRWRDAVMPTLQLNMRPALSEDRFGDAFLEGLASLENDVFQPMQIATENNVLPVSEFSLNVAYAAILHEIAHAIIEEFQIPVLSNEEVIADSFAAYWIYRTQGDKASVMVMDGVQSWLIEDYEITRQDYYFRGEHPLSIRRGFQMACWYYALGAGIHGEDFGWLNFSQGERQVCWTASNDQRRGWDNILAPFVLPETTFSENVQVVFGDVDSDLQNELTGFTEAVTTDIRKFDWPQPITLKFDNCVGETSWSEKDRVVLFCLSDLYTFFRHGELLDAHPDVLINHINGN